MRKKNSSISRGTKAGGKGHNRWWPRKAWRIVVALVAVVVVVLVVVASTRTASMAPTRPGAVAVRRGNDGPAIVTSEAPGHRLVLLRHRLAQAHTSTTWASLPPPVLLFGKANLRSLSALLRRRLLSRLPPLRPPPPQTPRRTWAGITRVPRPPQLPLQQQQLLLPPRNITHSTVLAAVGITGIVAVLVQVQAVGKHRFRRRRLTPSDTDRSRCCPRG